MGWFSPCSLIMLDLPATVTEVRKSLLAAINSCPPPHSCLAEWQSPLGSVCLHTQVCQSAGIYTSIPPTHLQGDICMLWKTSRNKCCRLFNKNVSASTFTQQCGLIMQELWGLSRDDDFYIKSRLMEVDSLVSIQTQYEMIISIELLVSRVSCHILRLDKWWICNEIT